MPKELTTDNPRKMTSYLPSGYLIGALRAIPIEPTSGNTTYATNTMPTDIAIVNTTNAAIRDPRINSSKAPRSQASLDSDTINQGSHGSTPGTSSSEGAT